MYIYVFSYYKNIYYRSQVNSIILMFCISDLVYKVKFIWSVVVLVKGVYGHRFRGFLLFPAGSQQHFILFEDLLIGDAYSDCHRHTLLSSWHELQAVVIVQ